MLVLEGGEGEFARLCILFIRHERAAGNPPRTPGAGITDGLVFSRMPPTPRVPGRIARQLADASSTEASELGFPPFEHWERFSARTISVFGAYTVCPTLPRVSAYAQYFSLFVSNRE